MSAPVIEPDIAPVADIPEGAHPIVLPVMAVEGLDTADGRYLEPGGITHRALPLSLLAQVRTPDGGDGHDNAYIVGAVTEMWRTPGPEVVSRTTGDYFPEGTFVWSGRGWMYDGVPGIGKSAYQLVKDRALSGNSIDLSDVVAEAEYDPADADDPNAYPTRIRMKQGVIAATTLVAQPAFPDAYVELDGTLMVPEGGQNLAAAGTVSWRSAELGDNCAACKAGIVLAQEQDVPEGEAPPPRRDGMIALVPVNAADLTVEGGDPEDQLHLTLAYLGDDVLKWTPQVRTAIQEAAQSLAASFPDGGIDARAFARAEFNPDGGPDGDKEPCAVYLIGDAEQVGHLRGALVDQLTQIIGQADMPEQHEPFVPHITAGYGVGVDALQAIGPVRFDRIRVALGGDVTDYPIGEQEQPSLVAAALPVLPAAAFAIPEPDAYTPPYITEPDANGHRYYAGHIAPWNACHIGFQGKCVTPPRSASKYAKFHLGLVRTENGDIPAGVITFNRVDQTRGGHADIGMSARAAVAHYDNTGTVAADVRVIDGKYGPWACGVVRSDLTGDDLHRIRMSMPSGDWRRVAGRLEMVGVLHVNTGGFTGARTLVASGEPMAMVAGASNFRPVEHKLTDADFIAVRDQALARLALAVGVSPDRLVYGGRGAADEMADAGMTPDEIVDAQRAVINTLTKV